MRNEIVILMGKCASGKDTIAKELSKHGYNFVTSTTSRPIRKDESEGNPYHFVTKARFLDKVKEGKFIEYRDYHTLVNNVKDTWYYGVEKDKIKNDKRYVAVLDTIGAKEFKSVYKDRCVIIYIDVDDKIRELRCVNREDYDEYEWNRRLADDSIRFSKENLDPLIDYIVENRDTLDVAVEDILYLVNLKTKG